MSSSTWRFAGITVGGPPGAGWGWQLAEPTGSFEGAKGGGNGLDVGHPPAATKPVEKVSLGERVEVPVPVASPDRSNNGPDDLTPVLVEPLQNLLGVTDVGARYVARMGESYACGVQGMVHDLRGPVDMGAYDSGHREGCAGLPRVEGVAYRDGRRYPHDVTAVLADDVIEAFPFPGGKLPPRLGVFEDFGYRVGRQRETRSG